MSVPVAIEGGFAEVGAGLWLMGCSQPAAFAGTAVRRRRKGFFLRDRSQLSLVETSSFAKCANAGRPFLTHIPCAAPVSAVSDKVLVAPASARIGAAMVKVVPLSAGGALCVTVFDCGGEGREAGWVVMSTASRTARIQVADGDTLSVRPEAVVAWTGSRPTGYCQKLGVLDMLLPRCPRDLLLHFHGPCLVWVEGSKSEGRMSKVMRRAYGA